ncbi:MAG: hypothetical protein ACE5J5_02480 [Candidatus Hydrothermarchaeales archaeon]
MGPRIALLLLFLLVIAANIITLLIRKKKFLRMEGRVLDLARSKEGALTLEEISSALGLSLYDTKILMRKSVSRGTTNEEIKEGKKTYSIKEEQG